MSDIKITLDGIELYADETKTVMQAAEEADIYIPHLCHHKDLHDVGGCRLCIVEIQGKDEVQTACTTKVEAGMVVKTKSEKLDKMRRLSMELMLANHVDDCTTCPKYLKCELQSLIQYLGVSTSRLRRTLNAVSVDTDNPLIVRDLNRCVACGRCVRVCRDVRGVGILEFRKNEEDRTYVGVKDNLTLENANCRFCGACVEVCPTGALQDKEGVFKEGNRDEVLIPCKNECPAGINVPKYVRFIKEGNYDEAAAVIREKAPFPKSLGLVCMRFCESACKRNGIDKAVAIRDLKRFAAEADSCKWKEKAFKKESTNKKVAVIGSGPAGLTAAYYLAKLGHAVDVFEKLPVAGGMLAAGIPDYRLPREIVESEIDMIREVGVRILTNHKVDSIKKLQEQGYDAVLVAVGTDKGVRIPIPGANLKDVYVNIDFLRKNLTNMDIEMKKTVAVLGGGNVAFDCARTAKRLGSDDVAVVCLESEDMMTASAEEIEEAKEEGIQIYNNRTFVKIEDKDGNVTGIVCKEVKNFYFDDNKKLVLNIKEDSEHMIPAEMIIFATGQKADLDSFEELELSQRGLVSINDSNMTNLKGVFAVGDVVTGTASVIQGIAGARKAASGIDIYLGGDGSIDEELSMEHALNPSIGIEEGFTQKKRNQCTCVPVEDRINNFDLMTVGLEEETAKCEASRCLQCDLRPELSKMKFWTEYKVK